MALPLLARAVDDDGTFVIVSPERAAAAVDGPFHGASFYPARSKHTLEGAARLPERRPAVGEQYRFHVDMDACIGCKCCVVACNEQNGNPADINWRRVAELEGGRYPAARRAHFSMGCNHCADPTCLAGCPVDAYSKDEATGIVLHSADTCIGCQYCTWTCSYGVPQFNPERGVVGKCDMCHGRLSAGQAPACVGACPEGAIGIEIVNVAEWRKAAAEAEGADGHPRNDRSLSTTRASLPSKMPAGTRPVGGDVFAVQEAHGPLVAMTVMTQLSAGLVAVVCVARLLAGHSATTTAPALAAVAVLALGLAGSTLHLGRPVHAWRAMKMWRRSWLSREVVLFAAFAKAAALFAAALWFEWSGAPAPGMAATFLGLAGVAASAFIYQVPSRPLWQGPQTFVQFFMTTAVLAPLAAGAFGMAGGSVWRWLAVCAGTTQVALVLLLWRWLAGASSPELRGAKHLITTVLRRTALARVGLLSAGGLVLPLMSGVPWMMTIALVLAMAGELAGRYLFFAAAVPRHMTASYLATEREAA